MEYYRAVTNGLATGLGFVGVMGVVIDPHHFEVSKALLIASVITFTVGKVLFKNE